jgi:hypothetical protein
MAPLAQQVDRQTYCQVGLGARGFVVGFAGRVFGLEVLAEVAAVFDGDRVGLVFAALVLDEAIMVAAGQADVQVGRACLAIGAEGDEVAKGRRLLTRVTKNSDVHRILLR